jgi:hypothetical protein
MEGISPKVARRHRYELASDDTSSNGKTDDKDDKNIVKKSWLSR